MINNKNNEIIKANVAKGWYLVAPVVVYLLSELDNIINRSCNWWLIGGCLLFLIIAQFAAKYLLENVDGGDISGQIDKTNK